MSLVATPSEPDARTRQDRFRAMVRYTDHLVGRLTRAVSELGLRERTLLIFTTDNGTAGRMRGTIAGVRPSGGKASKFEGGVCQPLIVHGPGRVPVGETDALTDFCRMGGCAAAERSTGRREIAGSPAAGQNKRLRPRLDPGDGTRGGQAG